MDDDVVLCPEMIQFLKTKGINNQSYVGMFWYLKEIKEVGISKGARSDEMFVILGRTLMNQIISKEYCYHTDEEKCDSLNQRFDTNYGGKTLGLWLSSIKDVNVLPLNDVALHGERFLEEDKLVEQHSDSKTNILIHHLSHKYNKDLSLIQQKYAQCVR